MPSSVEESPTENTLTESTATDTMPAVITVITPVEITPVECTPIECGVTEDTATEKTATDNESPGEVESDSAIEIQMIDVQVVDERMNGAPQTKKETLLTGPIIGHLSETPTTTPNGTPRPKRKVLTPDGLGATLLRKIECVFTKKPPKRNVYKMRVKTRDFHGASTDDDVYISLLGTDENRSEDLLLDKLFRDDLEKGCEDEFEFSKVDHIDVGGLELWKKGSRKWFCEYVYVTHTECEKDEPCDNIGVEMHFPCHLWIEKKYKYHLYLHNSCLPQLDSIPGRRLCREEEMQKRKILYEYEDEITGFPRRVKKLPENEQMSPGYHGDLKERKRLLFLEKKFQEWFSPHRWKTFDDLIHVYKKTFKVPKGWENWRSDHNFGYQRLNGLNTSVLRRCDNIPSNFPVTNEMVGEFLEGLTLEECIEQKRLFICNLHILQDMPKSKEGLEVPAPLALFFANGKGQLMPIAIQLFQQPADDNPIFLPSDDEYVWLLAKMYYNNADANIHQSVCHLGGTHFIGETICVAAYQSMAAAHPVHQLLAPHFLYLLAINNAGIRVLMEPGGFFDTVLTIGRAGFDELLRRRWKTWRMDVEGWLPAFITSRGIESKEILRQAYFRDDALLVHGAIEAYVRDVLSIVYDEPEKLIEDEEIQNFARLLVDEKEGSGMKGVWGGGKFENLEDLVKVVTCTIFICSVGHAAANFGQYDEYAFPPNYPGKLKGEIIRDKKPRTEKDIIDKIYNKEDTLTTMLIMHLLSQKDTNSLGFFEIQFLYEPKTVEAVKRFQESLKKVGEMIDERNKTAEISYPYLHPTEIPNAISI